MKLCFEDVQVHHQQHRLVEDLTFGLTGGQIGAIVGPSLSGKSTLLLLASGNIRPEQGRVYIVHDTDHNGGDLIVVPPDFRTVGLGPIRHFSPLFDTLTVREHLSFQLRLHKHKRWRQRLEELIETFDLASVQRERIKDIDQFSQFRTALANTTADGPNFILLDEPERGLSEEQWEQAKVYFHELTSLGVGILFTTVSEWVASGSHVIIHLGAEEVHPDADTHSHAP